MHKVLFFTLCISFLASPFTMAEELKADNSEKIKTNTEQKYFVKEICSKDSLENAINEWISQNTTIEVESVSYGKIKRKQCAIVLYEK